MNSRKDMSFLIGYALLACSVDKIINEITDVSSEDLLRLSIQTERELQHRQEKGQLDKEFLPYDSLE